MTDPAETFSLKHFVAQLLNQERQNVMQRLNWIRLMGVSFWLTYSFLIALHPSQAQPSTQAEVPFLLGYWGMALVLLSRRLPFWQRYASLSLALFDIPMIFVIRYFAIQYSAYPDSAVSFTLALFIMVIACSFLTLEPRAIVLSAAMVTLLQSLLQYQQGQVHQNWAWWSLVPILTMILTTAVASVYATQRLLAMVTRVAQEQALMQAEQEARAQLANKVAFLNQLATNLTHDLKSPLSSSYNTVQLLLRSLDKNPDKAVIRQQLNKLTRSFDKLNQYIAMSLDRDMLDQGKLHLRQEPVDVNQVCADVLLLHADYAAYAEIQIQISLPPEPLWVKGDSMRFEHVVANLVSNGLRYARKELQIKAQIAGDQLLLQIQDDGEGIPAEVLERLFERYAGDPRRPGQSTGLGLAICKQYIDMMAGQIQIESHPGQGTCVFVHMPLWQDGPVVV